jgi:hypothetical protein
MILIRTQGIEIKDLPQSRNSVWIKLEVEIGDKTKKTEITHLKKGKWGSFTCLIMIYPNKKVINQLLPPI